MLIYNRALNDQVGGEAPPPTPLLAACRPFLLGRTAIQHVLQQQGVRDAWLPAFVCRMVIELFQRHGCRIRLYDHLGPDLVPRSAELAAQVEQDGASGACFFWVDHWGILGDIPAAVHAACAARGLVTVVDAVHTLPLRSYRADWVIYGARKLLHLPCGALLRGPAGDEAPAAPGLAVLLQAHYTLRSSLLAWRSTRHSRPLAGLQRLERRVLGRELDLDREEWLLGADYAYPPLLAALRQRDLGAIATRRRTHFRRLAAGLGLPRSLDDEACPLGYPLVTRERDAVRARLWGWDVHTSTLWHDLHPLAAAAPRAAALAAGVLTMPVNQDLTATQLDFLVAAVRAAGS